MITPSTGYTVERMCFKKGKGELTKISKVFFKKDMSIYLSDDAELASKIKARFTDRMISKGLYMNIISTIRTKNDFKKTQKEYKAMFT